MQKYEGRLELTWTNKHLRLLAHEDGAYEWVPPADYRVAEVRLLHEVAAVGEVGRARARDNLLIQGDALNALTSLGRFPSSLANISARSSSPTLTRRSTRNRAGSTTTMRWNTRSG